MKKEARVDGFVDELEKIAFNMQKFREGLVDEGIPLGGATLGATLGWRNPLRGAALGYAAGSAASLARERLKPKEQRKEAPLSRKILAMSGMGYGLGGLAHGGLSRLAARPGAGKALKSTFTGHGRLQSFAEEGLPALGATLGTGVAMGAHKEPRKPKTASVKTAYTKVVPERGEMGKVPATSIGAQFGNESGAALKARILREQQAGVRSVVRRAPGATGAVGKSINALRTPPPGWLARNTQKLVSAFR